MNNSHTETLDRYTMSTLDRGHTCLCQNCGAGHSHNARLAGKERDLDFKLCPSCASKKDEAKQERLGTHRPFQNRRFEVVQK